MYMALIAGIIQIVIIMRYSIENRVGKMDWKRVDDIQFG